MGRKTSKSRRETPWDGQSEMTPTQQFIHEHHKKHVTIQHPGHSVSRVPWVLNNYRKIKISKKD